MKTFLFFLLSGFALAANGIYVPDGNSLAPGKARPSNQSAATTRPAASPVRPAAGIAVPVHHGGSVIHRRRNGPRSYHVYAPGYDENPFGLFQGPAPAVSPRPIRTESEEEVILRRYKLNPPSAQEVYEREEKFLNAAIFASHGKIPPIPAGEDFFRAHVIPLIKTFYRVQDGKLVPAYKLEEEIDGSVRQIKIPEILLLPIPDDEMILSAYRKKQPFSILRGRPVRIRCGMCEGEKRIPSERVTQDGSDKVSYRYRTCPRCDGSGSVSNHTVPTIYKINH